MSIKSGCQRALCACAQELMSPEFRRAWHGSAEALPAGARPVSCLPLRALLHVFGITHIDLFSLDVEGAELEVLQTVDFSAVRINVIVVEQDGGDPEKEEAVRQLLLANGFRVDASLDSLTAGRRNGWYVHKQFQPFRAPTDEWRRDAEP